MLRFFVKFTVLLLLSPSISVSFSEEILKEKFRKSLRKQYFNLFRVFRQQV